MGVARQGRECPAPPKADQGQWKSVTPSFDTTTSDLVGTATVDTGPAVDLTSDGEDNENVHDFSPSPKRPRLWFD